MSNTTEQETDWAEKIGKPALASIRDMVAALECDYERMEELRDERDDYEIENPAAPDETVSATAESIAAWAEANPDDAEELKELEGAAGECTDREDAEQRIHEDPLSLQVRSDWEDSPESFTASEFQILLGTGGPAVRIMGELDGSGEPSRAWLEVQDWFKPWTEYHEGDAQDTLLAYARCFTYGQ